MFETYRYVSKMRNVMEILFEKLMKYKISRYVHSMQHAPPKMHQIFETICATHEDDVVEKHTTCNGK